MALFDIAPEPKPKSPTVPQMRLLHVLANARLTIDRKHGKTGYEWRHPNGVMFLHFFHRIVADKVILNGWAEPASFTTTRVVYRISKEGRRMLEQLCEHRHVSEDSTQKLGNSVVCKKCARLLRCKSKQPTPHGAHRWHDRFGPICNQCWEFLYG